MNKLTTEQVTEALRTRYMHNGREADRWAFVREVRNGAGFNASRSCDAIAMGLWPSDGLYLHGHEIKVSRSDWRKELDDPSKSLAFAKHCHYWWIVAPTGVVNLEELPSNWGLLVVSKSLKVKAAKQATFNKTPEPLTYGFVASLLRRSIQQDEFRNQLKSEYQRGRSDEREARKSEIELAVRRATVDTERRSTHAIKCVEEFNKAAGNVRLDSWDAAKWGEAAKILKSMDPTTSVTRLQAIAMHCNKLAESLKAVLAVDDEN